MKQNFDNMDIWYQKGVDIANHELLCQNLTMNQFFMFCEVFHKLMSNASCQARVIRFYWFFDIAFKKVK